MGLETSEWYNTNCLIGFSDKRGKAWHYRASSQGAEPNHYKNEIPVDDVIRRLFHWQAVSGTVTSTYPDENGNELTITDPTRQTIIRPDTQTVFGVFKQGYEIHQHDEWLLEVSSQILDTSTSDLGIANAILLKRGAVAAVQFEVPETVKSSKTGIEFRPSLLAVGSMDGSLRTTFKRAITTVVCDNTMEAALAEDTPQVKFKHTKNSSIKLGETRDNLEIVFDIAENWINYTDALADIPVKGLQFKKFINFMAPTDDPTLSPRALTINQDKQNTLLNMWINDDRVSPWVGTAYGILQLNNTYNQHATATNKGTIRGERNMFDVASGKLAKLDANAMDTLFTKVLVDA